MSGYDRGYDQGYDRGEDKGEDRGERKRGRDRGGRDDRDRDRERHRGGGNRDDRREGGGGSGYREESRRGSEWGRSGGGGGGSRQEAGGSTWGRSGGAGRSYDDPVPMESSQGDPAPMEDPGRMPMELGEAPAPRAPAGPITVPERPKRPNQGKVGRPYSLQANWFQVSFKAPEVYQYAVHIKKLPYEEPGAEGAEGRPARAPRGPPREGPLPSLLCRAAMYSLSKDMGWGRGSWAFDGRANMYAADAGIIPGEVLEKEVITTMPSEKKPIKFAIKVERVAILPTDLLTDFFKGRGDPDAPHHLLQALDVVLKHRMGMLSLRAPDVMAMGRSFLLYDRQTASRGIGGGGQVWLGYKQAVRPCQSGLALTVDTAAGAVWDVGDPQKPRRLSDLMYDLLGGRDRIGPQGASGQQLRTLDRELRGLKVRAVHNGFKRSIVGVARSTPFTERFPDSSGREVSVADYFRSTYQVNLTDQRLPCIKVGNGKVLLPPEVCEVLPKQPVGKLSAEQTAGMIKHAAQKPDQKQAFIQKQVKEVQREASDEMGVFAVKVSSSMAQVQARILPPPMLAYGGRNDRYNPKDFGSWNMKDLALLDPKKLDSWAVVSFASKPWEAKGLGDFLRTFVNELRNTSIIAARDPPVVTGRPGAAAGPIMQRAVEEAKRAFRRPPQLILVVLPDTGAALYREIKQASDSSLGIPSQCIVAQKAKIGDKNPRGQQQYIANVALKINAKLGGRNLSLSPSTVQSAGGLIRNFGTKPYMMFGADVTHPGVGSSAPSIAAVVGSLDATGARYATRLSAQPTSRGRQVEEIIVNLKEMAKGLLLEFFRATGGKRPEHIFFYRDGVSEGQFDQVLAHEYAALRQACQEMGDPGAEYAPPITFISVQKRHQTRFFAVNPRDADRSGNVKPGVVVDTGICHPFEFDFFMNAHAGIQGTNRPVHYYVLADQNGFGADELQLFTYWLCYLFCRCTRSISLASPAQYAHLAAFRGRALMRGGDSDTASMASSGEGPPAELLAVHPALSGSMFFV